MAETLLKMDNKFFQRDVNVARITKIDSEKNESLESTLNDALLENARGPKRVQGDAGSVEQHSLQDLIAAERFLQSKKAAASHGLGIRFIKISPDGTV